MEIRRPLKRNLPRLGPPDIYPQDPKQREDELTTVNVKHGYSSAPLISGPNTLDEFGTAKHANIDAFGVYFSALLSEKHRINTIKDTQKKKQLVNTKEIWYVHAKTKNAVDNWFRDLANGTKSLGQLGKRIPIFNSKEGIFSQLFESRVPLTKGVWFIKMSAVHAIALSESSAKSKKRQVPDQYQELTLALTKYLKDILYRLFESYQQAQQNQISQTSADESLLAKLNTPKPTSSTTRPALNNQPGNNSISSLLNDQTNFTANLHTSVANLVTAHTASVASMTSTEAILLNLGNDYNQWQYQTQLARYLFDEGLLDRYDYLCFLLELIEKKRPISDLVVKLICPLVLEYVTEFSKSAVLSRRLAHVCARKLSQAIQHNDLAPSNLYSNLIYILSSIIQVICIECPTAMVRHHIVDTKFANSNLKSPLDGLQCAPSNLPMMESNLSSELRRTIQEAEKEITFRSEMSDSKWSCISSRKAENSKSILVNRLLAVLATLDKYNFDKADSANSNDVLYAKIFPPMSAEPEKDPSSHPTETYNEDSIDQKNIHAYEQQVVKLLCEWATTTQRTGEHRALVVARLLERRQSELQITSRPPSKKTDDLKSVQGEITISTHRSSGSDTQSKEEQQEETIEYVFQDLLVQFLDESAPAMDENHNDNVDVEKAFNNLVLLFGELIRCDVFSHYNYMCTLISRGMFNELAVHQKAPTFSDNHIDDVDADLCNILQDIKEGQQDEAADILLPDYLGGSRDESSNKNTQINKLSPFGLDTTTSGSTNVIPTNTFPANSVESRSMGMSSAMTEDKSTSAKSPNEQRHLTFVKHFPVLDEESFARDINQRNILLHGFGKEREEARHSLKKLSKEICKLLSRRACRDINDGGRVKKIATRDCFNPEATLHRFEALDSHDQHIITNGLSATMLEMFTGVSNGHTFSLPTLESVSFIFDLFCMASNVSGLINLVILILEELPDVEAQIKLKCPSLSHQYTHSIAMCGVGMLYRYHSCVLLLAKDDLTSIFESLYKMVSHIPNPNICMTSAERVIFSYLYDLYTSYQSGKAFNQYSWLMQKIKQQLQNVTSTSYNGGGEHDWTSTFLTNIVNQLRSTSLCSNSSTNPISNASSGISPSLSNHSPGPALDLTMLIRQQLYSPESQVLRQMNESPATRYRFVCDAIYLSATSTNPDLVNDIAILCADLTSKCPMLMNDWILALQALLCSAQRDHNYRQILDKINITNPQVMDNIAIFTAILVARRCVQLDEFIIKCAIGAILAPLGSADRQSTESGVRLTCHLLLTLFRNRESSSNQSRCNQPPLYNSHSAFGQTFSSYNANMPYNNILGPVSQMSLLQPMGKDSDGGSKTLLNLKYLCDHHLLRAACCNIRTECHITLLKAIRVLAISAAPSPDLDDQTKIKTELSDQSIDATGQLNKDGLDGRGNGSPGLINTDSSFGIRNLNLQTASLHQFADAILRLLCSQRWLHDKCLSDSDIFTTTDPERNILLDPRIDVKQSQRLLYMICYNKSPEMQADVGLDDQGSDQVASIVKMFDSLDVWSMRLSLMRLQFMFAYCKSQSNVMLNDWLDNLAKAVVDFFQKASQDYETWLDNRDKEQNNQEKGKSGKCTSSLKSSVTNINKVWLIEPLLNKLAKPSNAVQGKIIKASAALMESASVRANSLPSLNQTYLSTAAASTKFKERTLSQRGSASTNPSNLASTSLLGFQPFLSLLLSCLNNQDKERETLLTSLNSQLYQAIHEKVDDIGYKQSLQDGLELRLCLIGQMFDTIQRSPNLTSDWATLLLLLIMNNLVDPRIDYGLYVTVLDMLAMLIQTAYASDPVEQREEAKKQYQNLMKKFRKELGALEEKGFIQMQLINPLMPLARQMTEVITCEPMGSLVDTKGEKVENFYSIDKKKGLKVSELQEVSPWDLIEGHKNPAPLCWPWFGAIKLEHKSLRADENNKLMSWHTHTTRHDVAYYANATKSDEGPSNSKRAHIDKRPSQSNPMLKSLIEANDAGVPPIKKEIISPSKLIDEDVYMRDEMGKEYHGSNRKEDLIEDYCEMPVDLLFDSTSIETMIEDIKTAMHENVTMSARAKPPLPQPTQPTVPSTPTPNPVVETKAPLPSPMSHASSILAPVQQSLPMDQTSRSSTPQVSALSALQNQLNSPSVISLPEPKPKATRKKRASKKDTLAAQQQQQQQQQLQQQQQQQIPPPQQLPQQQLRQQVVTPPSKQGRLASPSPIINFQHLPHQHMQAQTSQHQQHIQQTHHHHPVHYQQQASQVQVPHGPQHIQQNPQQTRVSFQTIPTQQHTMSMQQSQHHMQPQHMQQQQQQQHMQQQQQQQQQQHQQHHPMQYQPQHPQRQHQMGHMQAQQIRLAGHQQAMTFPQQPQQIFPPQQAAGHSRPALTAMLHQKHAAAGNHPSQRFNF